MAGWIGFGVLFAAGCVALAFFFQPEGPAPEPGAAESAAGAPDVATVTASDAPEVAGSAATEPLAPEGAMAAVAGPEAAAALGQVSNLRLRTGTSFAETERAAVLAALAAAGLSDVQTEALPFAVATSRVGYYRAEDRAAAEALAAFIAPVLGYREPLAVRDYGALLDSAEPGRLDLWIGG